MDDRSYWQQLHELTSEFSQEQNPLKQDEILERILSLVATRARARNHDLTSKKPTPNAETELAE